MRRNLIMMVSFLGLLVASVAVWAQDSPIDEEKDAPLILTELPQQMIKGVWQPIELEPVDPVDVPMATNAAGDTCNNAGTLTLPSGGDTSTVNSMTEEASDPVLSCTWGTPPRSQGYRTAWYQFTAPYNGQVILSTLGSNYDTVLAIHSGSCGSLSMLACSDDANGFTSRLTLNVQKNQTYFVEVADWQLDAPATATLGISALMVPIDSQWNQENLMPLARSRHATAVVGNDIYVIGGQTALSGIPVISRRFERFETDTGQWVSLQDMPGSGYSNTTAAYVDGPADDGRIYLPGGYGGGSSYNMTHWAYDIGQSRWITRTAISGANFGWAAAVAVASSDPGYYLTGGTSSTTFTSTIPVRDDLLFYSPSIGTHGDWIPLPSMGIPRYAHTAALVNGKICVVGGFSPGSVLEPTGECYSISGGAWSPIASLNIARHSAGSAVGPDGKWYVFGGVNENGNVSETEVYDPILNSWTVLDVRYDLGASQTLPARAWPRGGVVGSTLWAIGGNNDAQQALSLVESLFIPTDMGYLPFIANQDDENSPDDHFGVARPLTFNVPQFRNFDTSLDFYDVYYFDLSTLKTVTIRLSQIPSGSNYDAAIYSSNKLLWGKGDNIGNLNETVTLPLDPGRYYVVVERVPTGGGLNTANYRLVVEK